MVAEVAWDSNWHERLLFAIVFRALKDYVVHKRDTVNGLTAQEFLLSDNCELLVQLTWPDFNVLAIRDRLDDLTIKDINMYLGWYNR